MKNKKGQPKELKVIRSRDPIAVEKAEPRRFVATKTEI